jgi:hypothetical protein
MNRRYQCISQFNAVALTELSQISPSLPSNLQVDGHTLNRCKKRIQNLMFGLTRTVPELGDRNRRAKKGGISPGLNRPIWRESPCLGHARLQLRYPNRSGRISRPEPFEALSFAQLADVRARIGQILTVPPHTDDCYHRLSAIGLRGSIPVPDRHANQFRNRCAPLPGLDMQRFPNILVKAQLCSFHDVQYTSPVSEN